MSRITSVLAAKVGLSLAALCVVVAVFAPGSGSAASFEECPPPTTVTVGPDGNPWHG
ncbi:hypothetical protein [Saccharothrix sp. Mg75]|uniref:hypothetical protein n=1 Tax=Saccharothrix sp. Mg75 TaxID=3445357 RepID=UPI003EEA0642